MLRGFFKTLGSFGVYLLAFFIPAMGLVYWCNVNLFAAFKPGSDEQILFQVHEGWTAEQIAEKLEEAGVIKNPASITFVTKYKMSDEERKNLTVVSGEYSLSPSMKPEEVLHTLLSGKVVTHDVLIPEGSTIRQIAKILGESGLVSEQDADRALRDRSTLAQLGVPAYIPEGFFAGGAYSFTRPNNPGDLIVKLFEEANKRYDQIAPEWRRRASDLGMQAYDILKLASLIEREVSDPKESKIISSVFHNRLRIGLPLESEAAIRYQFPDLDQGPLSEEVRNQPSPYNTFLNTGLPQTPICSPSGDSLEAALAPQDTDFLYMADKGDGTHDFSATSREHKKKIIAARESILSLE